MTELNMAFQAMRDGTGDFAAVKAAAEQTVFTIRPRWDMNNPDRDRVPVEGSFEDSVTPWLQRRVISREQWRELRDIWKEQAPAAPEGEPVPVPEAVPPTPPE